MIIVFGKKLYKLAALKRTIRAYSGLADFKIKNTRNSYEVFLDKISPEVEASIKDEFSNFVLAEMKND